MRAADPRRNWKSGHQQHPGPENEDNQHILIQWGIPTPKLLCDTRCTETITDENLGICFRFRFRSGEATSY